MKLDVVSPGVDPTAAWRRYTDVAFDHALALGDEIDLPFGRGVIGTAAGDAAANQVFLPSAPADAATSVHEITDAFAKHGVVPAVWHVPPGDAYDNAFVGLGLTAHAYAAFGLRQAPPSSALPDGVLIVAGRAARSGYAAVCQARFAEHRRPLNELRDRHLDDPHFDSFIAFKSGTPIATAGLQIRGQTGLLCDLYVTPPARRVGIGGHLIGRVLEIAARSQLAEVFASAEPDAAALSLLARNGFCPTAEFRLWS